MTGEQRFIGVVIISVCGTIVYTILFIALWQYKEEVAGSLFILFVLAVIVFLRGKFNEQNIRQIRFNPHQEIPFDQHGEDAYLPPGAQVNEYRVLRDKKQLPAYFGSQPGLE